MNESPEQSHNDAPSAAPHRVEPKSRTHVAPASGDNTTPTVSDHYGAGAASDHGSFVLFDSSYKTAGLAFCAFIILVLLVPTADPSGSTSQHAVTGVGMAAFTLAAIRWGLTKVAVSPSKLQLRTIFRNYRLNWSEVTAAEVAPTNTNRGVGSASLVRVQRRSGKCVKVDGVANWGTEEKATSVRQAVDLINLYASRSGN